MLKFVAVTMAALVALTTMPAHADTPDEITRVLIVGDSVTQGVRGDYTWRYFLWKSLRPGAADFVGSRRGTFAVHEDGALDWDYRGQDAYADPDFDQDHAALAGARLGRPVGPDDPARWFHEPIDQLSAVYEPDVIVSLWGVNDLILPGQTPGTVIDSYRDWLATARRVNPDVDFVIGKLPYTWIDGVPAFNSALTGLAAAESTRRSQVVVAETREPYTLADSVDYVHPNVSGQRKIATMVSEALAVYGLTPVVAPAAVPAPELAESPTSPELLVLSSGADALSRPKAPRRVRAALDGKRVEVRWRTSDGAKLYVVTCGGVTRRVRADRVRVRVRVQSKRCRVRATNDAGSSRWVQVRVRR